MAVALIPQPPVSGPEAMDEAAFAAWVRLLETRTGVVVAPQRKTFLVGAVRSRMREAGYRSFAAYFEHIQSPGAGAVEWATLVDRLTVHETRFFRHPPSFELIGQRWLPEQLARSGDAPLHAWSVGCASGEEAWSLAMVLQHGLAQAGARSPFGISASDVSAAAISTARAALYPRHRLEEIPAVYRGDYLELRDEASFTPVAALRRRVGFVRVNLLEAAAAPLQRLNIVFCQNVLIYFSRERRRVLLDGLASLLEPGGLLLIGAGEVTNWNHPALVRVAWQGTLAYQRRP